MAESDEKIEKLLRELPDNLDSVSFLAEKYSQLAGYSMDGALASRVGEALKRIRDFSEEKLKSFDAEQVTPESAVDWQEYLSVVENGHELSEEEQKRNNDIRTAIEPQLKQFDEEEGIADVDENTDIAANCEAWDKITEDIRPFEEIIREDGSKVYRVTQGFEGLGGFFAALDKEMGSEVSEMARLEAIQNLAVKEPSEDEEANRQAYIEELNSVLDQTGFHLWQEYQKQIFAEKHPELLSGFDFQAAMQIENQLNNPKSYIKALSEEEIRNADNRIRQGEPLSLAEMAGICKGRDLLNKPARAELMAVIERAAAAEKVEGSDLVALQYLLDEVERVPEYKKLSNEETLSAARRHGSGFRGNLNVYRQFQQTLQQQTVEFERNSFSNRKVLKSSLAAVIAVRSAAIMRKAERLSLKTKLKSVWGKIQAWDDKVTKKYPKLYPIAKSVAVSTTTGIAGSLIYSGFKLRKQIKENYQQYKKEAAEAKAEGREFYKNYRSYFFAKENSKKAWDIGGAALLAGISAGFGGAAVVEHGIAAVTGLGGQLVQNGLDGLSNGGAALSGLWNKVTNMNLETAKDAVLSVASNARVLSSTAVSVLTGHMASRVVAQEQRDAEAELDVLLQQYGVSQLPTDKKLLKMRSSDPAAYLTEVAKRNNLSLNQEQVTQLNSVAQKIAIKRKEKNQRRWGVMGGTALGLAFAGFFGAKAEDIQSAPTDTTTEVPSLEPKMPAGMSPAAESRNFASMLNLEGNNDDVLLSEKLGVFGNNRFGFDNNHFGFDGNPLGDNTDLPADSSLTPEAADPAADSAVPAETDGIDLNNLSDEQKHDLQMLFKRYPRAASLILEGNENPAVTSSPAKGVVASSKLQAMYEGGDIPPEKLRDMIKFAGEHFDAEGNFVGPDAEALIAEAEEYGKLHDHAGKAYHSGDKPAEHADNNTGGENSEKDNITNDDKNSVVNDDKGSAVNDDKGNSSKEGGLDIDADTDLTGDDSTDGNTEDNSADQVILPTKHELTGKGVHLTYHIEPSDNERGYNFVHEGEVKYDKAIFKQLNNDMEFKNGEYVAANGHIHHANPHIVREQVRLLCTEITKENYIAADIAARGTPTAAEQAFLSRHESYLAGYGIKTQTEGLYSNFESKAVEVAANGSEPSDNTVGNTTPENVTDDKSGTTPKTAAADENSGKAGETSEYGTGEASKGIQMQMDTHVTNTGLIENEGGVLTTQSGYSFKIDDKGDIIHQSVLSAEELARAEAEIFAALRGSSNLKPSELVFVNDYAKAHNIDLHAQANGTLMAEQTTRPAASGGNRNDDVQPSVIKKNGGGRTATRDPYNDDDIYYRPEKRNTGVAAASRAVATPVGDGSLEDSQQVDTSTPIVHETEMSAAHRIWQYKGVQGTYRFVDEGNGPTPNFSQLRNIPEQLNLREHIRGTHEWNGNATYEEYLGGAIRGTPNEVNTQFQNFCKNLEGSDVVYRDMQQRIGKGYIPTDMEQKWLRTFERDLRTMGLDYVDGKLTAVQTPQSLKAQWYETSDNIKTSQILQCRAQQYSRAQQYNR